MTVLSFDASIEFDVEKQRFAIRPTMGPSQDPMYVSIKHIANVQRLIDAVAKEMKRTASNEFEVELASSEWVDLQRRTQKTLPDSEWPQRNSLSRPFAN
jgi:hypothetical protein